MKFLNSCFTLIAIILFSACEHKEVEGLESEGKAFITFVHASRLNGGYSFYVNGEKQAFITGIAGYERLKPVKPGISTLEVRDLNNNVIQKQTLNLINGEQYTLYLIGKLDPVDDSEKMQFFVTTDDYITGTNTAKLCIIHAIPKGSNLDLSINDEPKFTGLQYGKATGFIDIKTTATNFIALTTKPSGRKMMNFGFPFESGMIYIVIVSEIKGENSTTDKINMIDFKAYSVN